VNFQTCRRHPGPRFLRTCPGCAQDQYATEAANRARAAAAIAASTSLVWCESHDGAHREIPECLWPCYVGTDGPEPRVGHPLRCCSLRPPI
jgi:hypothetical protein